MSNTLKNGKSGSTGIKRDINTTNEDVVVDILNSNEDLNSTSQSKNEDKSLDKGWCWVIVCASFFMQFIGDGIPYSFGLIFTEISEEFKSVSKTNVSWIASIMNAFIFGVGPIGSILVKKFSCRTVSIVGIILATIGYGTSYFATNVPTLYITLGVLGGLGFGLMYLPAIVIIPQYFKKYRGLAIGIAVCGSGLGTFSFEFIFGSILENFNWRQTLGIGSAIIFSSVFIALLYSPKPNKKIPISISKPDVTSETDMNKMQNEKNLLRCLSCMKMDSALRKLIDWSLLKNPVFLIFCLSDMLTSIGFQVPYVYLPEIEKRDHHTKRSSLLGLIGVSNVISRLIVGYLSDKTRLNLLHVYITSLLLAGIGTIVARHYTVIWWLRGYSCLYGVCTGIYISLKYLILFDLIGLNRFTDGLGLLLLFQSIGFIIGPPIVGELYDIYGIYKPGFYFAGSMILSSGIILFSIPIIKRKQMSNLNKTGDVVGRS